LKLVRLVVLVLLFACAFPAGASALELEVDNLGDEGPGNCSEGCTLRDAIVEADSSEGSDRITFGVEGTIEPESPLPELAGSVTVDATTAPGWDGSPVVALDGSETSGEGGTVGISVGSGATGSIYGLAIGGFGLGIYFEPGSGGEACGNYVGTDLSGTQTRPNFDGIWIDEASVGVEVGRTCGEFGGNLVSGNEEWGIVVAGDEVAVDHNLVGTDATGKGQVPNGTGGPEAFGGGIFVTSQATEVLIGGTDIGQLPHNVVAFNIGPGVLIGDDARLTTVRENSIHSNTGLGIERESGTLVAEITSVGEIVNGTATVTGAVHGVANTEYELEFFSNEECDPSGFGEGQHFVAADGNEVVTNDSGLGQFSFKLLSLVLPGSRSFTATATEAGDTMTSEFSNCVLAAGSPEEEKRPPPPPPPPPPAPPTPVNGKSVTVVTKSGRVLIKVPGSNKFVPLTGLTSIPIGSIIDATNGRVTLTSVDGNGVTQSADFYEGRFQVRQKAGAALVTLRLKGGDFSTCSKAGGSSAGASKKAGRRLWGSGSGRFRTQGNFGSASVMGTIWLTADQCNGTLFKVRRGVVKVVDFVLDKTISLPAGKSYLAEKP
jgi:hypothetical protein